MVELRFAEGLERELIAATAPGIWLDAPNEAGSWWFINRAEIHGSQFHDEPYHVRVEQCAGGRFLICRGQNGWTRELEIDEMTGKWMKVLLPKPPEA